MAQSANSAASRRKNPKVAEVPEDLAAVFEQPDEAEELEVAGKIPLGGEEFRVLAVANAYLETGIADGDPGAFREHFEHMIHPDDWEGFSAKLKKVKNLSGDHMIALWKLVWEIAAERPTQ